MSNRTDSMTFHGASALISRIRKYWRVRGKIVRLQLVRHERPDEEPIYFVRSDMVGGLPREG